MAGGGFRGDIRGVIRAGRGMRGARGGADLRMGSRPQEREGFG